MIWMISANGNMYDHASSFATNGFIDWRQRANTVWVILFISTAQGLLSALCISAR